MGINEKAITKNKTLVSRCPKFNENPHVVQLDKRVAVISLVSKLKTGPFWHIYEQMARRTTLVLNHHGLDLRSDWE